VAKSGEEDFLRDISGQIDLVELTPAPSRLKAKVYSALLQQQAESGPLLSFSELHARGQGLCVFEQLVQIAPLGRMAKSPNICRFCHARVLAERFENPPIYWRGCPYVGLKNS
jgi:hypothetical protein